MNRILYHACGQMESTGLVRVAVCDRIPTRCKQAAQSKGAVTQCGSKGGPEFAARVIKYVPHVTKEVIR
jgi:hypothetical protein